MASFNKVILMGNLTRDPQLRFLPSQTPVVEIGLAVNRRFKKQDGSQGEEVCFIDCCGFGKTAENINKFFTKGRSILIEGRLQLDTWQAQDGAKRSKHRVFIENFQFVDSRSGGPGGGGSGAPGGGGGGDHIPF
ncbi:MAG: single-stranded DNA-binding protein [Planctomycetota bacterium]|nr:single-stranded DNA-binding protein [Planctomycetota bacterium]